MIGNANSPHKGQGIGCTVLDTAVQPLQMQNKWRGEVLIKNVADSEVLLSPGEMKCEVKAIYDQADLYTMSNLVTGKNIVKWAKVSNIEVEIGSGCELTKKQASVAVNRIKLSDAQLGKNT